MIRYDEFDGMLIPGVSDIMEKLGIEEVTEQEVWDVARGLDKPPVFENIYYELALAKIAEVLDQEVPKEIGQMGYYVNAADTSMYFNKESFSDFDSLVSIMIDSIERQEENEDIDQKKLNSFLVNRLGWGACPSKT